MTTITELPVAKRQSKGSADSTDKLESMAEILTQQLSEKNAVPSVEVQQTRVPPHKKLIDSLESIKTLLAKPYIPTLTEKAEPELASESAQTELEELHEQPLLRSVPQDSKVEDFEVPFPTERLTKNQIDSLYEAVQPELKNQAQTLSQEVITDFVPEIEAEVQRRLNDKISESIKELISEELRGRFPTR